MLERLQEVFLELETRELFNLHELHGQLSQRIQGKIDDICVTVTSDFVEMSAQDLPDVSPFEADTGHVVAADLDELLQREEARAVRHAARLDLLPRDVAQCANEVDNRCLQAE